MFVDAVRVGLHLILSALLISFLRRALFNPFRSKGPYKLAKSRLGAEFRYMYVTPRVIAFTIPCAAKSESAQKLPSTSMQTSTSVQTSTSRSCTCRSCLLQVCCMQRRRSCQHLTCVNNFRVHNASGCGGIFSFVLKNRHLGPCIWARGTR